MYLAALHKWASVASHTYTFWTFLNKNPCRAREILSRKLHYYFLRRTFFVRPQCSVEILQYKSAMQQKLHKDLKAGCKKIIINFKQSTLHWLQSFSCIYCYYIFTWRIQIQIWLQKKIFPVKAHTGFLCYGTCKFFSLQGWSYMILFIPFVAILKIVSDYIDDWKPLQILLSRTT